jgi:hypothetical protein
MLRSSVDLRLVMHIFLTTRLVKLDAVSYAYVYDHLYTVSVYLETYDSDLAEFTLFYYI